MVGDFIRDNIERKTDFRISHQELYENYLIYCKEENVEPDSKNKFGRLMNAFGYGADLNCNGVRMHRGIRLKRCKH